MAISNAVDAAFKSLAAGYEIKIGDFADSTPFLPQRMVMFGEANDANQGTLDVTPFQLASANEAGDRYGYGSPIHQMARIAFPPLGGDGIGGIPLIVIPQISDVGAVASSQDITVVGTATKNATHKLYVNGRNNIDGKVLDFSVIKDETATEVAAKINTLINSVLSLSITSTVLLGVLTGLTKFNGITSTDLDLEVVPGLEDAGMSYTISAITPGSGVVDLAPAIALLGTSWNTIFVNPYGAAQHVTLEAFIGNPVDKTGLYTATDWRGAIAIWGSTESDKATLIAITDAAARKSETANALCPAPNSKGWPYEAAINGAILFAQTSQTAPETDSVEKAYLDMPIPLDGDFGDMSVYLNRQQLLEAGCSTAIIRNGKYQMMDFITTYHPDNDNVNPAYRYCRNLMIDFNFKYAHSLRQLAAVNGKALGDDNVVYVTANVIKPKVWKQELYALYNDLASKALIVDVAFSKTGAVVGINGTNPDRLDDFNRYKRSGFARILSTTVQAGFQLGNV